MKMCDTHLTYTEFFATFNISNLLQQIFIVMAVMVKEGVRIFCFLLLQNNLVSQCLENVPFVFALALCSPLIFHSMALMDFAVRSQLK